MSLTTQARELYGENRRLAAKWVCAVRHMQARGIWILKDAPAKWGRVERRKSERVAVNPFCIEVTVMDRYAA